MQKAFDSIPHCLLLSKLSSVGIRDPLLKWFASYLEGRNQVVSLDNCLSSPLPITSGAIQGTVLGPLLFLIYISSITDVLVYGKPFIFADDIKLVYSFAPNTSVEAFKNIQSDLDALEKWTTSWQLKFSSKKSNIFCYRCLPADVQLKLSNSRIPTTLAVTDLGIRYSSSFNFSEQVVYQVAKARRTIGYITHSIQLPLARLELYKLRVRPLLEYCSIIYSNLRKCDRVALERVQRTFTKSIVGLTTTLSYRSRCQSLAIEPLWLRRLKLNLSFLHSLIYGHSFTSLHHLKFLTVGPRTLRNKASTLPLTVSKTNLRSHFFLVKYSLLWNKLPQEIRETTSLPLFRKRTSLFLTTKNLMTLFGHFDEDSLYEAGPDHI
jgi:sarcosine oxidase/L-pipecolate oxidase